MAVFVGPVGVVCVEVVAGDELASGVLTIGAMEVAQLDNDPSFPENGKLELILGGGR